MEKDEAVEKWLAELQVRLNSCDRRLRRQQALNELLLKITELMRNGNFKSAAVLRKEFDKIRDSVE
jgi:hypothetical protein